MASDTVGHYEFQVEPFQEDFTGSLSWGTLGNSVLRVANYHASERGFARLVLNGELYVWVLSRMSIDVERMPQTGERFAIETWVRNAYRCFTDRCFDLLDPSGNAFGHAYTIWALINMTTRRPAEMSAIDNPQFASCINAVRTCPQRPECRIRVKSKEPLRTLSTYYSDIDVNNHVNSIRYIEHILDLYPADFYSSHAVGRIDIAYNEETLAGDTLTFFRDCDAGGVDSIEVRKNVGGNGAQGGIVACRCRLTFKDKTNENKTTNK